MYMDATESTLTLDCCELLKLLYFFWCSCACFVFLLSKQVKLEILIYYFSYRKCFDLSNFEIVLYIYIKGAKFKVFYIHNSNSKFLIKAELIYIYYCISWKLNLTTIVISVLISVFSRQMQIFASNSKLFHSQYGMHDKLRLIYIYNKLFSSTFIWCLKFLYSNRKIS